MLCQHIQTRAEGKNLKRSVTLAFMKTKNLNTYYLYWHKEIIVFWLWPVSFTYEIFDEIKD